MTTLVCIAYQSESRGVSLEELDEVFKTSPWRQMFDKLHVKHRQEAGADDIELAVI